MKFFRKLIPFLFSVALSMSVVGLHAQGPAEAAFVYVKSLVDHLSGGVRIQNQRLKSVDIGLKNKLLQLGNIIKQLKNNPNSALLIKQLKNNPNSQKKLKTQISCLINQYFQL